MRPRHRVMRLVDVLGAARAARQLARQEAWSREQLEAHQERALAQLTEYAARHSAFWRERPDLPVLDRETLMARFDDAATDPRLRLARLEDHIAALADDDALLDGEFRVMATSGTTGRRGVFVNSRAEWRMRLAGALRLQRFAGLGLLPRRHFATVTTTSPLHISARFALSSDVGIHVVRLLDARTTFDKNVKEVDAFGPDQVSSVPSILALLAREQLDRRLTIRPQTLTTVGEDRTEGMEAAIRAAWPDARLQKAYATTEIGVMAADCEHETGMHLFEDLAVFENLDEHGAPVSEGGLGSTLVVSDLVSRAQPRLRIAVSDRVAITSEPCPCGRPFRRIARIAGRSDDVLELPAAAGGTVSVHPFVLRAPMAARSEVLQYQVVHDRDGLHIRVVPRGAADGDAVARTVEAVLTDALRDAGAAIAPRVHIVEVLERDQGHGAKVKVVSSCL